MGTGGYRIETGTAVQRARAERDLVDGRGFRAAAAARAVRQMRGPLRKSLMAIELPHFFAKTPTIQEMNLWRSDSRNRREPSTRNKGRAPECASL